MLTVFVHLLEVLVHDAAGPHGGHLVAEQRGRVVKGARRRLVAAVLGEEDGHVVVGELLGAVGVARGLELVVAVVATPGVDVVAEEVDGAVGGPAVDVVAHGLADGGAVVGCVADADGPVVLLLDVRLHVAHGGFHEGDGVGGADVVGHLVAGEEAERVGVLGHQVHHGRVARVQRVVPRRVGPVDADVGRAQVGDDVDAGRLQRRHALVVVLGGVDGVHADGVGGQLRQVGDVALAGGAVGQRVDELVARRLAAVAADALLVGHALDEELGAVGLVEELGPADDNGVDVGGERGRREERRRGEERLEGDHGVAITACNGTTAGLGSRLSRCPRGSLDGP